MLCTIVYSEDNSFVFDDIEDVSEAALRERFGFADGEDHIEANYRLTVREDGKKVHAFYMEGGYEQNAIWVIEG